MNQLIKTMQLNARRARTLAARNHAIAEDCERLAQLLERSKTEAGLEAAIKQVTADLEIEANFSFRAPDLRENVFSQLKDWMKHRKHHRWATGPERHRLPQTMEEAR